MIWVRLGARAGLCAAIVSLVAAPPRAQSVVRTDGGSDAGTFGHGVLPPAQIASGELLDHMPEGKPVEHKHRQTFDTREPSDSRMRLRGVQSAVQETPLAGGDVTIQRDSTFSGGTFGTISSVNEPNTGSVGDVLFQTGNWLAARSTNNGSTWSYISPYTTFRNTPTAFSAGFCCDQRVAEDTTRGLIFWYLQYIQPVDAFGTPTAPNGVRIAIGDSTRVTANTWLYYSFTANDFGFPGNYELDFPNLAVSSNYLYFTSNVFAPGASSTSTGVEVRLPISALATGGSVSYDYYTNTSFASFATVNGATSTMYFGARTGPSTIRVLSWPESSTSPTLSSAISLTGVSQSGTFSCLGPDGRDPCTRADTRMQTAWVSGNELGFMWSSAQTTTRPYPYTRAAILDASTLAVTSEPDIWSSTHAWLYPAVAVNARGHEGGSISALGGDLYPTLVGLLRDDLTPAGQWSSVTVAGSSFGTNGRWGDYNGAAVHQKYPNTWLAAGHVQLAVPNNQNSVSHNFWLMRGRDNPAASQPVVVLDAPANGSAISSTFTASGWTIDRGATSGTGIDAVHVYATASGGTSTFLGVATYGSARADIGNLFGSQFTSSGFTLSASGLASGTYTIAAYAHSTVGHAFSAPATSTVTVTAPVSRPVVLLDGPQNDRIVGRTVTIEGWAIEQAASSGTGVDAIHVYAYPTDGSAGHILGVATYGLARPDVGAAVGSQFTNSGFRLSATVTPPGKYRFVAFAHSTIANTFNGSATAENVTVQSSNTNAVLYVDTPSYESTKARPFTVSGWAVDSGATSGTGIDFIDMWAFALNGAGTYLGPGTYGLSRPDIGSLFGDSRFTPSGFTFTVGSSNLAAGTYDIVAFGRSTVTNAFTVARVVRVTVQ